MRKGLTVLIVAVLGVFAVKSVIGARQDVSIGADLRSACGAARRHEELPVRRHSAPLSSGRWRLVGARREFLPQNLAAGSRRAARPVDDGRDPGVLLGFEPQPVGDPAALAQPHRDVGRVRFRRHGEAGADAPFLGVDENSPAAMSHIAHHVTPRRRNRTQRRGRKVARMEKWPRAMPWSRSGM